MLGNTGYIGYPVVLLLPQLGVSVFSWALFYDALGTLLGSYGLGAILAAEFGNRPHSLSRPAWASWPLEVLRNPIILAFLAGLALKAVALPPWLDTLLYAIAWGVVMLSLLLMGLRIQQIRTWRHLSRAGVAVAIKMLLLPLAVGLGLTLVGIDGPPRLVMVLQAGMPSAFANLVLAEAYNLDRELSVTCVGLSSVGLLLTLPLWVWGFSPT
jgi:predicted permease